MNNTEKKLDALIDALGFDVERIVVSESLYRYDVIDYKLTKRDSWHCDSGDKFTDTSKGVVTYAGDNELEGNISYMESLYDEKV